MADALAWTNTAVGCLALLISIAALVMGQLRANKLQARIVELEEGRERERVLGRQQAVLRVRLEPYKNAYRFVIANDGAAEASNVRLYLDGKPQHEHGTAVQGDALPNQLGAGATMSCLAAVSSDCPPPFEARVLWDDESGADREYRTVLTF